MTLYKSAVTLCWCDWFACVCRGQQFVQTTSVDVCVAELQSLEYGEVRAQCRLRVAQSLVVAVDNASDAIEITDENHHTQVLSQPLPRAHRRHLGPDSTCVDLLWIVCTTLSCTIKPQQVESLQTNSQHVDKSRCCTACCTTCCLANLQQIEVMELGP